MADIALTSVIQKAVEILGSLLLQKSSDFDMLEEEISWIEREMRHIQSYLEDAEAKHDASHRVSNLINDIRDLAFDLEDIIDAFLPQMAIISRKGWFMGCFFYNGHYVNRFIMEIRKIKRRVEDIDRVRTTFGIMDNNGGSRRRRERWDARRSYPHVDEPNIIGFEEHIKVLQGKLVNTDLECCATSIVGMAGLGKTTLAKKVYKHVKRHFQCTAWIYVSQDPTVREVLQDVARQVGLQKEAWEENVEKNLFEYLSTKSYVIVFDDIWNKETWDALKVSIPNNCENGSRIIITSRNRGVGLYIGGERSLYELQPLKPRDSWKLFAKMAMGPTQNANSTNETSCSNELENIGRQILRRCGGVPLAIVVAAGLLSLRERIGFEWRGVLESMGEDEDECSRILALSYQDLPTKLKACFLYFGFFPEDHEISAFELINIWVAEGFVQSRGVQEPEDVAEEYLSNLIARNLIQVARRKFNGRIKSCRVHDLLHNLCILEARKSNFFNIHAKVSRNSADRVRRVSTQRSSIKEYISLKARSSKLRALLWFHGENERLEEKHFKSFLRDLIFLRVLIVDCKNLPLSLPNEIGNLTHLSYLRFRGDGLKTLPSTIVNLKNLLTLDIQNCHSLVLPTFIWKMKQLRHILVSHLIKAPSSMGSCGLNLHRVEVSLPYLRTLYVMPNGCLKPLWLRKFTNLRKLGIAYCNMQVIQVLSNATPISQELESLLLRWSYSRGLSPNPPSYIDSRTPSLDLSRYQNLRKLHLEGYMRKLPSLDILGPNLIKLTLVFTKLDEDSMEMLKKLPKLKFLKLGVWSYVGRTIVCSEADTFPQLEVLEIIESHRLEELIVEGRGMPKLNKLRIHRCGRLHVVPEMFKNITIRSH